MIRLTLSLIVLVALVALVTYVANLPGHAQVVLGGYQLDAPVSVLIGLLVFAMLALLTLGLIVQFFIGLPARLRAGRAIKRQAQGELAMATALMALARGDAKAAGDATALARQKLPQKALPHLMAAQSALLEGQAEAAADEYRQMLYGEADAAQKALGLEGLFYIARRNGADALAQKYATQVLELTPKCTWALDGLMALAVKENDWQAAETWLRRWARSGVNRQMIRYRRAVVLLAEAQDALAEDTKDSRTKALQLAEKASAQNPDLVAAKAMVARLYGEKGGLVKARRVLRQAWARAPHPELAQAWLDCYADQPATQRVRAVSSLTGKNPEHKESYILRARVALAAQRWTLAQTLLQKQIDSIESKADISRRLCLLMADAENGLGDLAAAQVWQDRARRAPLEAGWMSAGLRLDGWQAVCPVTGNLGTVEWGHHEGPQAPLLVAPS